MFRTTKTAYPFDPRVDGKNKADNNKVDTDMTDAETVIRSIYKWTVIIKLICSKCGIIVILFIPILGRAPKISTYRPNKTKTTNNSAFYIKTMIIG